MKQIWSLLALCALCAVLLTGCSKPSNVTVETGDAANATEPTETRVTVAIPQGQLSIELLMSVVDSDTAWSELSPYTHELTDAANATFSVMGSDGKTCTLEVTFDAAADKVTKAILSYGETSSDVLTDDNTVALRAVMMAMNEGE